MADPAPIPRKSIHLFDLDDTLIRTSARVLVRDAEGALLKSLTPAEFTGYRAGPGEALDFREFSDLGILSRGIVVKYTRSIIDSILKHGTRSHFGILTARSDKHLHAPFLIRLFKSLFGIRLAKEHIFAVSDARFARFKDQDRERRFTSLSIAERKALVIAEDLVGRGFNDISFYDDSRENLDSFKVLREAFPHVVYKPHFIDPTWRARILEFLDSGKERKCLIKGLGSAHNLREGAVLAGADSGGGAGTVGDYPRRTGGGQSRFSAPLSSPSPSSSRARAASPQSCPPPCRRVWNPMNPRSLFRKRNPWRSFPCLP
jgi:hypothetical protein